MDKTIYEITELWNKKQLFASDLYNEVMWSLERNGIEPQEDVVIECVHKIIDILMR